MWLKMFGWDDAQHAAAAFVLRQRRLARRSREGAACRADTQPQRSVPSAEQRVYLLATAVWRRAA